MTILISFFLFFFQFQEKTKIGFYKNFFYFYSIPCILTPNRCIPTLIPRITPIPRIPTLISGIPTLIRCVSTLIPCVPTLIPRILTLIPRVFIISLVPFLDSLFRSLQITEVWK